MVAVAAADKLHMGTRLAAVLNIVERHRILATHDRPVMAHDDVTCRLGMPPEEAALQGWRTRTPLLVMGSAAWNRPYDDAGSLVCGAKEQAAVLAAAAARR